MKSSWKFLIVFITASLAAFIVFAALDETWRAFHLIRYYSSQERGQFSMIDHPFLTVAMKPNSAGRFRTNSLGYRTAEFSARKPLGTYRIVLVGGSAGVIALDNDHTFAKLLEDRLNRANPPGRHCEVVNAAVPYYTSTQELFLVATQVIYWQPDMVIVYDGWNDAFVSTYAHWRPNWTPRNDRTMRVLADEERPLQNEIFIFHLFHNRSGNHAASPAYSLHLDAVQVYKSNLQSLIAILKDRGIDPVLVFQPSLIEKVGLSTQEHSILAWESRGNLHEYLDIMRTVLPLEARALEEVADREHVRWANFTEIFDGAPESTFYDVVHQTDFGNRIIANRLFLLLKPALAR